MEYEGYNGKIVVDGDVLILEHAGIPAKVGGLVTGKARRIPLQAVSGVSFKPASRMTNGSLTLGLGGAEAREVSASTAASDPNTILFRHKAATAFRALYDWLLTVVAYNREHGIDSSAFPFDAAEATRRSAMIQRPATGDASSEPMVPATLPDKSVEPQSKGAGRAPRLSRRERAEERQGFERLALAAAHGDVTALRDLPAALDRTRPQWRAGKLERKLWDVLAAAIRDVGSDDILSEEEESRVVTLAGALGLQFGDLRREAPEAFEQLVVCRVNDGRPPTLSNPPIMTKRDEVAFGAFAVALMKEVTRREFRGGSAGVSIPIGLGMRYRTSSFRGRSVVVGTEVVAEDSGILVVTSSRTLFAGGKKTLEFRHDRLVGMQQYSDGLRLNVSNRQTASLFKFESGESPTIAAALITCAAAHSA